MYRLRCFGGASVLDSDGQEIHFRSRKHLALLLYLAAHSNRPLTRDRLVRLLWDTEKSLARHSLSQGLYDLRKRLSSFELQSRAGTVRIREGRIDYEGSRFEDAVQSEDLRTAVNLFRGDFAPNLQSLGTRGFERWLESERTRFRTLGQLALRKYAALCEERGTWSEMCLAALRLVRLDPLDERGHRALMKALWLQGDRHSALQHYAEIGPRLERELPAGLSRKTRELVERIKSARAPVQVEVEGPEEDPLPMVGREEEFRVLRRAVNRLTEGRGGLVVVQGEAGIGKTRLMEETARLATVEGLVGLKGRCYPAESDVAYGPILDGIQPVARHIATGRGSGEKRYYQLGHLFPELFGEVSEDAFETVDPAVRRRRLFEEVTDLLRRACRGRGVLWIVEDIQWIDSASGSLLHYIRRRLKAEPLLLVLTRRTEERQREAVTRLLAASSDSGAREIELAPLRADTIRTLLGNATSGMRSRAAIDLATRYCGGNPFYALEILQAASSARDEAELASAATLINDRLRNLLTLRLRGLSARALRLLEAVAVLERHATPENVLAVTGLRLDGAAAITTELRGRRLLHDSGERLEFPHDISREYIYTNLGSLQRAALHLTVGEVLAEHSDVSPATLARHFERGGDRARAYEFAMRAATASTASSAHDEAARMATLAADVATSPEEKLAALRLLADAQLASGNFTKAELNFREILSGFSSSLQKRQLVNLHLSLARALFELSRWDQATRVLEEAHEHARAVNDPVTSLELQAATTRLTIKSAIAANDELLASAAFKRITDLLDTDNQYKPLTDVARVEAAWGRAAYESFLGSSTAARGTIESVGPLTPHVPPALRQQYLLLYGLILTRLAEWDRARAALGKALDLASDLKDVAKVAHIENNLACVAADQGDFSAALTLCNQSSRKYDSIVLNDYSSLPPRLNRANCYFYMSQYQKACELYESCLKVCARSRTLQANAWAWEARATIGLIALQKGDAPKLHAIWKTLKSEPEPSIISPHEAHKKIWLKTFLTKQIDVDAAAVFIQRAKCEREERDLPEYLKLQWLQALLFQSGQQQLNEARSNLLQHGMRWFAYFTERWTRVVEAKFGERDLAAHL